MSGNGYGMRFLVRNNCFSTRTNFSDVSMNKTSCLKILLINTAANALTHTTLYYYLRARIVYALLRLQTWTLSFRVFQTRLRPYHFSYSVHLPTRINMDLGR